MKIFFNDVETTGFSEKKQDIIQIGALLTNKFTPIGEVNLKCQPIPENWKNISSTALSINNISKDQIKTYGTAKEAWEKYSRLLLKHYDGAKYVFGAQNAPFDRRFLSAWWNRNKTDDIEEFDFYFEKENLDLMAFSRAFKKEGILKIDNIQLKTVIKAHNIKVTGNLHDALVDIKATGNCIYKSLKIVEAIQRDNPEHPIVKKFKKWNVLLS